MIRRNRSRLAGALVLLAALGVCSCSVRAIPCLLSSRPAQLLAPAESDSSAAPAEAPAAPAPQGGLAGFLSDVKSAIRPLEEQVEEGSLVPQFGQKAAAIVEAYSGSAGELERTVDGLLHALFLRQLTLLRQQLAARLGKDVLQADEKFVAGAEELKRPGSDWSYTDERYALRAVLEGGLKREEALAEESADAKEAQQSTVEIISKLQSQMESLQQKVQAMRAGSPWFLSASWRIPRTPIQLIARHQQGRTNLEFSLNQDRDPANSEAGFVQGVGPMNLGMNVQLGS